MTAPRPPRSLHVVDALGMGGAETWLMEVLRQSQGRAQLDFLITGGQEGFFDEEARALGATLHYVRFSRATLPQFIRRFREVLKAGAYDAIHDHQAYVSGWHFLAGLGRLPRVRVTHVHNASVQIIENYGITPLRRLSVMTGSALVALLATHIAGTSRRLVTEYGFDSWPFARLPRFALHCGVDTSRFRGDLAAAHRAVRREFGWPADARIMLFVGRMDRSPHFGQPLNQKNSAFAVAVGLECARRDPRVRMVFAGRTTEALPVLEQRIAEAGLTDHFRFCGNRSDVAQLMLGSDLLLFPSRAEGLGMVAVEGQASGLPVLASTGVSPECVVVPELVRFLDPGDGAEAWAGHALQMLAQPRDNRDPNARVTSSKFAIDHSLQALLDVYGARTAA